MGELFPAGLGDFWRRRSALSAGCAGWRGFRGGLEAEIRPASSIPHFVLHLAAAVAECRKNQENLCKQACADFLGFSCAGLVDFKI